MVYLERTLRITENGSIGNNTQDQEHAINTQ